jgi:hypothetical protein
MWFKKTYRWNNEQFLRKACDQMTKELNWDSLDSGCLHHTVSQAKTIDGQQIIVGVVTEMDMWDEIIKHIQDECRQNDFPQETPVWLYVPKNLIVPVSISEKTNIIRV